MTEQQSTVASPAKVAATITEGQTFNRRRLALKYATKLAAGQQVGKFDADVVVEVAKKFDAFLKGGA